MHTSLARARKPINIQPDLFGGFFTNNVIHVTHLILFIDILKIADILNYPQDRRASCITDSPLLYGKLVHDEKEHSDWFLERSEFCNTDR